MVAGEEQHGQANLGRAQAVLGLGRRQVAFATAGKGGFAGICLLYGLVFCETRASLSQWVIWCGGQGGIWGFGGGSVVQLSGSFLADCSQGRGVQGDGLWARDWAFGASGGSDEQVNFVNEFDQQRFNCTQHLRLQVKRGGETRRLVLFVVRVVAVVVVG